MPEPAPSTASFVGRHRSSAVLAALRPSSAVGAVVVDDDRQVLGAVARDALERTPEREREGPVSSVMSPVRADAEQTLEEAMQALAAEGAAIAVVLEDARPAGVVTTRTILRPTASRGDAMAPRPRRGPHRNRDAPTQPDRGRGAG